MRIFKIILKSLVFCLLTIFTQIGGIIYLLSFLTYNFIDKHTKNKIYKASLKMLSFVVLYTIATFLIVPLLAPLFGRVALPLKETNHLRPLTFITCLLNRNYVRPELKYTAFNLAQEMNQKFPGTVVNYLDGNFPFINKFPLLPHLSHNDGKKLDLAFCYKATSTQKPTNDCPSFIGYGICEEAFSNETNTADFCGEKGYWQYSFLKNIVPQGSKTHYVLDNERTKALVELYTSQEKIGKVFIEPHLKTRLELTSDKIRFHGCQAVRHDDHIHVQLK